MEYVKYDNTDITDDIKQPNDNLLINSCFQIWQRGDSMSPSNANKYTADRWRVRGTLDGTVTFSRIDGGNGMQIKTTSNPISQIEQIIKLNKRLINSFVTRGITSQLRFNRTGSGDNGTTTLIISILDSSQGLLIEKKDSAVSTGISNPKTLTAIFTAEELLQYEDNMAYITYRVVNSSMIPDTTIALHWAKIEYGIYPTTYVPKYYSDDLRECEEYFAIRGINIRIDANSTEFYRYMIPFNLMLDKNPTITITSNSGDIKTSSTKVVKSNTPRALQFEYVVSSTGSRKQVTITAELDGEIY